MLIKYFPDIMDVKFTARMESDLDEVEEGNCIWQNIVRTFYKGLEEEIIAANGDSFSLKAPSEESDVVCEKCGAKMIIKQGKFGKFLACPNYPKCKNTKKINDDGEIVEQEQPIEGENAKNAASPWCLNTAGSVISGHVRVILSAKHSKHSKSSRRRRNLSFVR